MQGVVCVCFVLFLLVIIQNEHNIDLCGMNNTYQIQNKNDMVNISHLGILWFWVFKVSRVSTSRQDGEMYRFYLCGNGREVFSTTLL